MANETWGVILACGKSEQLTHGVDVAFLSLGGRPIICHSIQAMQDCPEIDAVLVVTAKERVDEIKRMSQMFGFAKVSVVIQGGVQRNANIKTALAELPDTCSLLVLQDVSRPLVAHTLVTECVKSAKRYGCAVAAHKVEDSIKIVPKGLAIKETAEKGIMWLTQSPFACKTAIFSEVMKKGVTADLQDEADAVLASGTEVRVVPAPQFSINIATSDDIMLAEALLKIQN